MEKNKKLYYILMAAAVVLLMVSYGIGFMVGKNYGYTTAKKEFEVEKQKLMKTIASLTPLSRPKPEEKVVVVNGKPAVPPAEKKVEKKVEKKQEVEVAEKKEQKATSRVSGKPVVEKKTEVTRQEVAVKKEVKRTKEAKKKNRDYFVQVGIFSKKVNAERLVHKLKKAGIPASVSRFGRYYRVTAGMFTEKEAKSILLKLKRMKLSGIIKKRR
ncbi:SPOR domain-containing protein [Desulfurobacterium sp.]